MLKGDDPSIDNKAPSTNDPVAGRTGKLRLQVCNNLARTLNFNFYDICFARILAHRAEYIDCIDEEYKAE